MNRIIKCFEKNNHKYNVGQIVGFDIVFYIPTEGTNAIYFMNSKRFNIFPSKLSKIYYDELPKQQTEFKNYLGNRFNIIIDIIG